MLRMPAQTAPLVRGPSTSALRPVGVAPSWADPGVVCQAVTEEAQPQCWDIIEKLNEAEAIATTIH